MPKKVENPNLGKSIRTVPKEKPEIGIDTDKTIITNILDATQVGSLNTGNIEALSNTAQTREQTYQLIDSMASDDSIAAVLETYTEDTVETNDKGQVVWCESSNGDIMEYVSFLLDSLNVDKNIYEWTYSLITYGDLYLRLYRKSDYGEDLLFNKDRTLNENLNLNIYKENDHYAPYVEMVSNPCEMIELTRFGKTQGYIRVPISVLQQSNMNTDAYSYLTRYKMKNTDVEVFDASNFVHACLNNASNRQPETVDIYTDDENKTASYNVKRGQSILYNTFRGWRELTLLENSALLSRLTKSSIVRILNVDVGDMPKEQVNNFMTRLKEKIEQKTALNEGNGMAEYNNPGPVENIIYVPTHGTQGNITASNIGGDYDPKSLTDIEYFRDKVYGSLKVPKQFFGFTEDGAGFNGGSSLAILSSRYGKSIKRIQNTLCQMITDIVNLFLIDRGLTSYINKFTIRMQAPVTQEELDKRANNDTRIRYVNDVMTQLEPVKDDILKIKVLKVLLSGVVNDAEVTTLLQDYIDSQEATQEKKKESKQSSNEETSEESSEELSPEEEPDLNVTEDIETSTNDETTEIINEEEGEDDDSYLPSPAELNINLAGEE